MKTKITIGKVVIEIETDEEETAPVVSRIKDIMEKDERREEPEPEEKGNGAQHPLSARELRIVELLCEGMSNKMIALRLCCTKSTIKVHMKTILRKMQCKNRTQAALLHQTGAMA